MLDPQFWSVDRAAGALLLLGSMVLFPGLIMFWIRGGQRGGAPPSRAYYVWERSLIMAAVVLTAIGFILLDRTLENTNGHLLARIGAAVYLVAGILGVAAEAFSLRLGYGTLYRVVTIYVVLAFVSQVAIGASSLQAGLLATWVGWVTIVWNLAWLVILPLITPRDIYFPVLHHVAPLLIGVALLWRI